MSPVFDCSSEGMRREGLAKAAEALRDGKLVVLPTDTLYGIGADAFNRKAVQNLLAAKGRGRHMPPPVLVGDVRTIDGLAVEVPDFVTQLIEAHWPGPLTVILKAQPSLSWDLGDTNGTVALRMPDHEIALALLKEVGPMAVSSANVTGWPAARTVVDAATQLGSAVFVYLDAGPVGEGLPSTIVDCTTQPPTILREGTLSPDQLAPYLPANERPTSS
jgi:L-threonylcarbamoyladenylate synthase